ncbi:hypothetical protein PUN28_011657 [Cardiocondyla obscurior]|uniref:Uncharacterized protein n=1 Tax=Cardiocondyla obscurior TaxID=286306 RepID=A0AAW2FHH7_9HYME
MWKAVETISFDPKRTGTQEVMARGARSTIEALYLETICNQQFHPKWRYRGLADFDRKGKNEEGEEGAVEHNPEIAKRGGLLYYRRRRISWTYQTIYYYASIMRGRMTRHVPAERRSRPRMGILLRRSNL